MQSTSCKILGWMTQKIESRLLEEISQSQICRRCHSNGRKQRETRASRWGSYTSSFTSARVKKLAYNPTFKRLRSWHLVPSLRSKYKGEKWGLWQILFSWAPKWLWNGDWSHEIKRYLLLGRKAMTNLDSISKSRNITLLTKVRIVKAMVFPVVMYGCENWAIKKAECQRIGCQGYQTSQS